MGLNAEGSAKHLRSPEEYSSTTASRYADVDEASSTVIDRKIRGVQGSHPLVIFCLSTG